MRKQRRGARLLLAAAVATVGLGVVLIAAGTAAAESRVGATAVIRFWPSYHEVTLTIPVPACPTTNPSCEWLLEVNEPDVPAQTVLGTATGSSGMLTVNYSANFCGVIQADALIGPSPWYLKYGHQETVSGTDCTQPTTPTVPVTTPVTTPAKTPVTTPVTTPPAVVAQTLPYTATTANTAAPAASVATTPAAAATATTDPAQLPFTGVDVRPLLLTGSALVLAGLYILTTLEQRRRALMRVGASVRTNPVGVQTGRVTRWLLGE